MCVVGSNYAQQVRFPPTPYLQDAENLPEMSQVLLEPLMSAWGRVAGLVYGFSESISLSGALEYNQSCALVVFAELVGVHTCGTSITYPNSD